MSTDGAHEHKCACGRACDCGCKEEVCETCEKCWREEWIETVRFPEPTTLIEER